MSKIEKTVIPAAGFGTRLRPLTFASAKELLVIRNKPLIQYSIEECISAGVKHIAIVINNAKDGIRAYLENVLSSSINFEFIYQEQPTGVGDAILLSEEFVNSDPFFIIFPDILFQRYENPLIQLANYYTDYNSPCIALISTNAPHYQIGSTYGYIDYEESPTDIVKINALHNKGVRSTAQYKTTGRAVWNASIFTYLRDNRHKDSKGEYSEIPALQAYIANNELFGIKLNTIPFDCGTLEGFRFASSHFDDKTITPLNKQKQKDLSVIVPVFNEDEVLNEFYSELISVVPVITDNYEIIFIDDGSTDDSWHIIEALHKENNKISAIKFSRNFGQHTAITAGLDYSNGGFIVLMDADLQDCPDEIPKLLEKCRNGSQVVYAVRKTRDDSTPKKVLSRLFYRVFNRLSTFKLNPDIGMFRVITRQVRDDIVKLREQTRIINGLVDWLGYDSDFVYVDRPARFAGKTKYHFRKMFLLAMQGIMSFSNLPLRVATYLGFIVSSFSFFMAVYFLAKKLLYRDLLIGWPSLITSIFFLAGVQLLVIGILGEYIGKIFQDVKQRPLYVISKRL